MRPSTSTRLDPKGRPEIKQYTFEDMKEFVKNPKQERIIIDVREPSELSHTGRIPTSINIPIGTSPDFAFLTPADFEDRFDMPRPDPGTTDVIFYCKAGVRSRAAARLAQEAGFGRQVGEFPGSWREWEGKGGDVER